MLMQLTGFKNNGSSMTHQHRDKFNICKRTRVRAHYAHIRAQKSTKGCSTMLTLFRFFLRPRRGGAGWQALGQRCQHKVRHPMGSRLES